MRSRHAPVLTRPFPRLLSAPAAQGENAVALMRTVKRALDPQNILNPGKIVDIRPRSNPAVVDTASKCAHSH